MVPPASPETASAMASKAGQIKRSFRQIANSRASWLLLGILIIFQTTPIIWSLIASTDKSVTLHQVQILFGLNKIEFFSGNFWQLVSHVIIHGNWFHLSLNGAAIILLGSKLEQFIAKRSYWLLSLYSSLAGGLLFLLLTPFGNPEPGEPIRQTLVGSSAICFAFLVLLTTLSPDSRFLPIFVNGKTVGIAIILAALIFALLNPELPTGPLARFGSYLTENGLPNLFKISHACHFGGALTGWLYGRYLLRPRISLASLKRLREKSERAAQAANRR